MKKIVAFRRDISDSIWERLKSKTFAKPDLAFLSGVRTMTQAGSMEEGDIEDIMSIIEKGWTVTFTMDQQ